MENSSLFDQRTVQLHLEGTVRGEEVGNYYLYRIARLRFGVGDQELIVGKELSDDSSRRHILIDLGNQGDTDKVDFDYGAPSQFNDHGVFLHNGFVQVANSAFDIGYSKARVVGPLVFSVLEAVIRAEDDSTPDDVFEFTGLDDISFTDQADRFIIDSADRGSHSGTGEIDTLGGNDLVYITSITPGRLEIDTGTGDDTIVVFDGQGVVTVGGLGPQPDHQLLQRRIAVWRQPERHHRQP